YTPRKKQNPVMIVSTPRDDSQHIRSGQRGESVCDDSQHIDSGERCDDGQHVSRSTIPKRNGRMSQGSLMARAPTRVGDVGSSPTPVTSPTSRVLEMVAKLSPEVRLLALGLMP